MEDLHVKYRVGSLTVKNECIKFHYTIDYRSLQKGLSFTTLSDKSKMINEKEGFWAAFVLVVLLVVCLPSVCAPGFDSCPQGDIQNDKKSTKPNSEFCNSLFLPIH